MLQDTVPSGEPPSTSAGQGDEPQKVDVQAGPTQAAPPRPGRFRFWIEEQCIKNPSSVVMVQEALEAAGGVRSGGPPKSLGRVAVFGYMHLEAWELLWTVTKKGMETAQLGLPHGKAMCIIPGMAQITRKSALYSTLQRTAGKAAAEIMPLTFALPRELQTWQRWLAAHPEQDTGMWMLKNNQQRGTGLKLVPTAAALQASQERHFRRDRGKNTWRWLLAQRYITNPLTINGLKSGIRVWVLVTEVAPLRAYLHCNGLLLFSSQPYQPADTSSGWGGGGAEGQGGEGEGGAGGGAEQLVPTGHVTNFAQNEDGDIWALARLQEHLGDAAYRKVWGQIRASCAAVCRACCGPALETSAALAVPPHSCFQVLGLDFLLDASLHAWLLEVNATPSLAAVHRCPTTQAMVRQQKMGFLRDALALAGLPDRFQGSWPLEDPAAVQRLELLRLGGFVPLHLPEG